MSQNITKTVEVIIPIFNPPRYWSHSCLEHMIAIKTLYPRYRFHFTLVNDGSPSNIFRHIKRYLKKTDLKCNFFRLSINQGKGKAMQTGVKKVNQKIDYFICVDWDFPFGIIVLEKMFTKLEAGYDLVISDRGKGYLKKLPFMRSLLTNIWRWFIQTILHLDLPDTQGGLKSFAWTAKDAFESCTVNSFLFDFEFILECFKRKLKVVVVETQL